MRPGTPVPLRSVVPDGPLYCGRCNRYVHTATRYDNGDCDPVVVIVRHCSNPRCERELHRATYDKRTGEFNL